MKIIELRAENVKKLVAIDIKPDGNMVEITGRNGQGKTSVLDSIWWALTGLENITSQPIRRGQTKARITLDLGELKVERRFTEKGSSLIVESADGARFPSPQTMLDKLIGSLSFDPLAFTRMKPKDQYDEVRRVAKLETDIEKLDAQNASDYAKRTDINRDAKTKRAQAEGMSIPANLPEQPIDESALLDAIQSAGEQNAQIETRKLRREQMAVDIASKTESAYELTTRAAALRKEADELDAAAQANIDQADEMKAKLDNAEALPEPVDAVLLRMDLDAAKSKNVQIAAREQRKTIIIEAEALEAQAAELTKWMEARETAKLEAIKAAHLPVEGLGFGAGIVTYNDVPLDQASSAEQLRVSLGIAMAANPKLRVIHIQDGSLLDGTSLAQIAEMAAENDYQIWIERVDTTGKVGFVIEDGLVVGAELPEMLAETPDATPAETKPAVAATGKRRINKPAAKSQDALL